MVMLIGICLWSSFGVALLIVDCFSVCFSACYLQNQRFRHCLRSIPRLVLLMRGSMAALDWA